MRKFATVLIASSLALIVAGCGADDGTEPTELPSSSTSAEPSAPTTVPTTPSADAEEQAIIAAYKGYYDAVYDVVSPAPQDVRAAFAPYAESAVVENWVKVFQQYADQDKKPAGYVTYGVITVSVVSDSATVNECRDGSTESTIKISDGETIAKGEPGISVVSELRRHQSVWLVHSAVATPDGC